MLWKNVIKLVGHLVLDEHRECNRPPGAAGCSTATTVGREALMRAISLYFDSSLTASIIPERYCDGNVW